MFSFGSFSDISSWAKGKFGPCTTSDSNLGGSIISKTLSCKFFSLSRLTKVYTSTPKRSTKYDTINILLSQNNFELYYSMSIFVHLSIGSASLYNKGVWTFSGVDAPSFFSQHNLLKDLRSLPVNLSL